MSNEVENNETAPEEEPITSTEETSNKPKKKGKGRVILLTVVIAVVLLCGGGGIVYATQHDNPQFCNAVCHVPMTPYVESFMDGTSVNPQQTDLNGPISLAVHIENNEDMSCLTCHDDGIASQIQEGITWVTGNYTLPLELTMTIKEPTAAHQRSGITTCLESGCHAGITTLDDLKKATADDHRNPHDSHNGAQDCSSCHQMHEQSVQTCSQCHGDTHIPDGWISYNDKQKQIKEAAAA